MVRLNHLNLAVNDVPALTRFFTRVFGFRLIEQRGRGTFSVLVGDDGFALILMHDKRVHAETYPALFHVGFRVESMQQVGELYSRVVDAGFQAPAPDVLDRGGYPTFGFYCEAPGGVRVEVSTPAKEPLAS